MPWYQYSAREGEKRRPLLEVRLSSGARSVYVVALVDSGADISAFNAGYAYRLGLRRDEAEVGRNIGADGRAFPVLRWPGTPLEIEFEHYRFPFRGSFFDSAPGADTANILGRNDFFSQFVVQFWDAAELLNIDRSPEYAIRPLA